MKRLIYYVISLLGFSMVACGVEMYGSPYAHYRITARVVDEAGKPIEGIRVGRNTPGEYVRYSDSQGNIDVKFGYYSSQDKLVFEDVDGEANGGEFETQIVDVVGFKQTEKGDGNWYGGAYEAHLGDVTMKRKAANSEDDNNETTEE